MAAIAPWDGKGPAKGAFLDLLESGPALAEQGRSADARAALEKAEAMFPTYAGPDAPALGLARLARDRGDIPAAVAALARHNALDESAFASNMEEAALREELGDLKGAMAALERLLWIAPNDAALHLRLAATAERLGEFPRAVRERRATLALAPSDPLEARYQLASILARAGQTTEARREILQVLEVAPGFEKAQALLLKLRGRSPEGTPQ